VQVDPSKPTVKAPGSMLSKLRYDGPVSNFAFNFNLRRYTKVVDTPPIKPKPVAAPMGAKAAGAGGGKAVGAGGGAGPGPKAGAYTVSPVSST